MNHFFATIYLMLLLGTTTAVCSAQLVEPESQTPSKTLDRSYSWDVPVIDNKEIFEIGGKSIDDKVFNVTIFKREMKNQNNLLLSSFFFDTDGFQIRLYQGIVLKNKVLAIIGGTTHPNVNLIIFYDLITKKPLGIKFYSTIIYDTLNSTITLANPYPRSVAKPDDLQTITYSIFVSGHLNPELQDPESFRTE